MYRAILIYGITLLLIGLFGFFSLSWLDGFFYLFLPNSQWINIIFLASGALALFAALFKVGAWRLYFQSVGILFGFLGIGSAPFDRLAGLPSANGDRSWWLFTLIALVAMIYGFGYRRDHERTER